MDPQNWINVKDVFYSALNLPEAERSNYLDSACRGDSSFRSDVEVLLKSYESGFLEDPAWPDLIGAEPEQPPFLNDGDRFSHYEIVRLLGRGGMGEVYLAHDLTLDRKIAIKVLHEGSGLGEIAAMRLLREARSVARLDHPNICSVYEVGETSGRPFIAMQYLEGQTIHERLKNGPIPLGEAVSIMRKIAAAVSEAHLRDLIHRDIKPSNIVIDSRGQLRVLDFGLAKHAIGGFSNSDESDLGAAGMIAGTVAYMSPEQARGQTIDARTDIWSLGVVFYQLLTGRLPFLGKSNVDTAAAILDGSYPPPSEIDHALPQSVDALIARCLEPNIENRYASVEDFDDAIGALDGALNGADPEIGTFTKVSSPGRRRYVWGSVVVLAMVVVVLSTVRPGVWGYIGSAIRPGSTDDASRSFSAESDGSFQISKILSAKHGPNGKVISLGFSPDGKQISFVSAVDDRSSIYVKPLTGGDPIQITDGTAGDQTPIWSPDGERIAFISDRNGNTGVWSVSSMGGTPVLMASLEGDVADHQLKKWGNDGRHVYLESHDSLGLLDLETGERTAIDVRGATGHIDGDFDVSSDESMIAFQTSEQNVARLWAQPIVGGDSVLLAEGNDHHWSPAWFPDGQRLAYNSDHSGNFQIYVRDINTSEPRQITFGDLDAITPVVSPDGEKIGYISEFEEANIYSFDIADQHESIITSRVDLQLFPGVSSDGRHLAFQTTQNGTKLYDSPLNVISLDAKAEVLSLGASGCCVEWSPSGNEIVYARFSGTDNNIWKLDVDSRREMRITNVGVSTNGNHTAPYALITKLFDWSPDGQSLAFTSGKRGEKNIWTVAADGSSERQLTNYSDGTTSATGPVWSLSGNAIAFIESRGSKFVAMSKENRVAIVENGIVSHLSEPFESMRILGWSRDGSGVLFAVKDQTGLVFRFAGTSGGGKSRVIGQSAFAHIEGIRLSPDRRAIIFSGEQDGVDNLYMMSSTGGKISRITVNEDSVLFFSGVRWSPDGTKLFYSKQNGGAQISLISDPK